MTLTIIADIIEALMLVCFGMSWPLNAYKSWKARTAKGTNWQFFCLITIGYLFGIFSHIFKDQNFSWILLVYIINIIFVAFNFYVYFRNLHLDKQRALKRAEGVLEYIENEA